MNRITLIEAINQALTYEMARDNSVIVLGEDVGINGGVFRATMGLLEKFGSERVLDTPIAESAISGISVGMAAQGLKPVAEFQFGGFIYSGFDHIISHAARLRNRTRGRLHCPIVYRVPFGGGIRAPEHHSESMEALFAHIPGLRVVIPSSPDKAYRLLLASIRNADPVLFLEPKRIYRLVKQKVLNNGKALPLDQCFLLRSGFDVTLITWGAMIKETMEATHQLAQEGIKAEIIDVATIKPLDMDTILSSVEKTGRCLIIHEAPLTGGVGAEISANIAEQGLFSLLAPIKRITGYDTIMPYFQLEKEYIPSANRIVRAVRSLMEFS
ncbi:alpha-ketoacid dehydrogenase subunit beta [Coxiella endosymbiont of Amblyomma americanum]|uniref:alpha-ketoacid dehydrogenase subunit beta n=1 Tax=Coxiella endosymbiont of Amblyomma americanum TaxID=325775 RepID=UPI00057DB691|nr:alpha-ketoacid dehydrogenase subunit beta [Coxiella endosymbiont of Amblyomma americanum]AJC50318.1 2-oxoisovalerate dehydrogenase [Coxiella endosymbiont of Amblyomma americanum]AUJ58666.1 alpha-ketoacid dehydrogenase subunit beta [Coxiella-like endosymbiont of Amblyomma americanum]